MRRPRLAATPKAIAPSVSHVKRRKSALGRLLGFGGDLEQVRTESLVPEAYRELPLDQFLARLSELDEMWAKRVERARGSEAVLRYRATVARQRVRVGVVEVHSASALGALTGTEINAPSPSISISVPVLIT